MIIKAFIFSMVCFFAGGFGRWVISPDMAANGHPDGAKAVLVASNQGLIIGGIVFTICIAITLFVSVNSNNDGQKWGTP